MAKPSMTAQAFVDKWRRSNLKERSGSQEHFIDLCRVLGHPTPAQDDPQGERFTFEKGATKQTGGDGWADVWKKGVFAWEYKGKHKNLDAAYDQLLKYRESLLNPPLLIVSDMEKIVIHTNFTNTAKRVFHLSFDDLLTPAGMEILRNAFENPEQLQSEETTEAVTQQAAAEFSRLAESLRAGGHDSEIAAHFLIRILFCLFAEDVGLLPENLFTRLIQSTTDDPKGFQTQLGQLFDRMSHGGFFGIDRIPHFNGGLFDDDRTLPLSRSELEVLARVAQLDWSSIEPSIFGTLFERSLDPGKRTQLGAHYTSRDDILLLVEPVLMRPLRRRWAEVKAEAAELAAQWQQAGSAGGARTRARNRLQKLLHGFADEIADTTVLDPACGSGNFLYVALRQLLNLEKEVIGLSSDLGLGMFFPTVSPEQLFGIERNETAHELAQATIWIGYIQWLRENGFGQPTEPILKKLDNIHHMDAILAFDEAGNPVEPAWPEADVIIGNPPFLGGKLLRKELGDDYVDRMFIAWKGRVARESDLCCYWFEKARSLVASGSVRRSGLLATQGIRGGANRKTLKRITDSGAIFWAQSDREWILDGAAVHVSMLGFDSGSESLRELDGQAVEKIHADLTSGIALSEAFRLPEQMGLAFMGDTKGGPFDVSEEQARKMLAASGNPNGKSNSDVIRPRVNARDVAGRQQDRWIIDFGIDMPAEEASQYEVPFNHILTHVKPLRDNNKRASYREKYWIHVEPRPAMRRALRNLTRYIATPAHSKHRLFAFVDAGVVPDHALFVFAREDDYFFGVLHSRVHELWARRQGTQLREAESGFRYTPTTCFETFPFPWPPGDEPVADPRVIAISDAAKDLVAKRDRWLHPEGATEAEQKKRTLTNLYNQRPTWLDLAHRRLDNAVLDAYGWPHDLSDDAILEHLLALNLERAAQDED